MILGGCAELYELSNLLPQDLAFKIEVLIKRLLHETRLMGDLKLRPKLGQRPFSDVEKMHGFFQGIAFIPFGYVTWNTDRAPSKLLA